MLVDIKVLVDIDDIEESENVNETAIAIATRASGGLRDRVDLRI